MRHIYSIDSWDDSIEDDREYGVLKTIPATVEDVAYSDVKTRMVTTGWYVNTVSQHFFNSLMNTLELKEDFFLQRHSL